MNVLSLFDGMSCGQIALNRLGIKYDNYYASEIDKYAIQVTQKNYPNTKQIGDVTKIKGEDLPKIDLLIGGSPCQGFSFAGKRLNFEDPRSKLFFEYVRLLNELKPKYFLLENVKMKKESQDVISKYLGVEPIKINSNLLSAQNRSRLYWTNIGVITKNNLFGFTQPGIEQPPNLGLVIKDILEEDVDPKYILSQKIQDRLQITRDDVIENPYVGTTKPSFRTIGQRDIVYGHNQKIGCLMATDYKQPKQILNGDKKTVRKITPVECERFQTVPENYTEGVSNTRRYQMLGNGWTVDVICHIFKNLPKVYHGEK